MQMNAKSPKASRGNSKALITSSKNWLDESDSEEEDKSYALMAEFEDATPIAEKVPSKLVIALILIICLN